ncbi:MAG: diphthine--ammonia ligase [Nitrososphaerales archaeon]
MPSKGVSFSSGGKDSVLAMHLASSEGIEIQSILTMLPDDPESMLYHTHNLAIVEKIAEAIDIPWITIRASKEGELIALEEALSDLRVDYLISGGIESFFQKRKFDEACRKANLRHYAPLWHKSPQEVYRKLTSFEIDAIIVSVAAYGLEEDWLGSHLTEDTIAKLLHAAERYRFNAVGEGGDLDTLVLDAPLFKKRLIPISATKIWEGDRGRLEIHSVESVAK